MKIVDPAVHVEGTAGGPCRGQDRKTAELLDLGHHIELAEPPLNEQREIASFLARQTSKSDTLIAEAQRAIDLLQERRTALISAAVTGQIDVRPAAERASA